jgi:NHL repeat
MQQHRVGQGMLETNAAEEWERKMQTALPALDRAAPGMPCKPRIRDRGRRSLLGFCFAIGLFALTSAPASALPAQFASEGEGAGQITEPRGIAVEQESGDLYLTDRNNARIDKFGPEGEFLLAWGWGVADGTTEAFQTCTTTCFKGLEGSGAGQFRLNEGIAVDNGAFSSSHGDVYVVDSENHRIQKFGPQGELLLMFGGEVNQTEDEAPGATEQQKDICTVASGDVCKKGVAGTAAGSFEFLEDRSIAVDSTGTVYVGDKERIQWFSSAGVHEGELALPGIGPIVELAADSSGDIYVNGGEITGVRKLTRGGAELGSPRNEANALYESALTVGPANSIFVNDFLAERHHINAFDAEGKETSSFDEGSVASDGGRGIAYSDKVGALYVLQAGTVRIVSVPALGPVLIAGSEASGEVSTTMAELTAMANPEGSTPTSVTFEYGTSAAYGASTAPQELTGGPFEDQSVSAPLSGLQPRTLYHYRVLVSNTDGETRYGPDQTFTTLPPVSIDETSSTQVNATSGRIEAELNPHGLATEYHFEYGTDTNYGTSVPIPSGSAGSGLTDTAVGALLQGLLPSTTYHYRVVASNALGTVEGPDRSFTTQGEASTLPDGREWELVSPANKHGASLEPLTEEGGVIQAAADGGAIAYVALGPVGTEAQGVRSPDDSQLLSKRGPSGWSTQDVTTPHEEISMIHVAVPSEYRLFDEGLSAGVVEPEGVTPLSPQTTERTPYLREASGEYLPLVTSANVLPGAKFGGVEEPGSGHWSGGVEFIDATSDLSHIVLESHQVLTQGFKPGFEGNAQPNLYELANGTLRLISVLPSGEAMSEAGSSAGLGNGGRDMRDAISTNGERVILESRSRSGQQHLYLRDIGLGQTIELDEAAPGVTGEGSLAPSFQSASSDDHVVFFSDQGRLTSDATARPGSPDLYMCEVEVVAGHLSCALTDLTVDQNPAETAHVETTVTAVDAAGDHIYFGASGVLTDVPNAQGEHATPGSCDSEAADGTCNLYVYERATSQIKLVAVLSSHDGADWNGLGNLRVLGNLTARVSPNGQFLSFMSQRSLTGYDNRDEHSGAPDEEVFLFDAENDSVHCVSCDPTGARPSGVFDRRTFPGLLVDHPDSWIGHWLAGSIPGWTLGPNLETALYQSRYLSNSGRMFFNATDGLVPQDTNGVEDVYEYEPPNVGSCTTASATFSMASGGCVGLISSGTANEESAFLDASENGDEVFFLTSGRLVSTDIDSAFDVYDAHVCSIASPCAAPLASPPPACVGDACQNPSSPLTDATPTSLSYHGPGNAAPVAPASKKPLTRAQKLAKALKACRAKRSKRKRASCEKAARKQYGVALVKKSKVAKKSQGHVDRRTK